MEVVLYEFGFDYAKAIGFFIVLLIGAAFFFADKLIGSRTKEISPKVFKIITRSIGAFCLVVFLLFFTVHIAEYNEYKTMLESDSVSVVEGYVENYNPLPADGKGTENFEINGVYFAYSNADGRNGYTAIAKYGGVITMNGQHLRIKYVTNEEGENIILYISEIG